MQAVRKTLLAGSTLLVGSAAWELLRGRAGPAHSRFAVGCALLLAPTLRRNSAAWGPIHRTIKQDGVWLTIDDGPDSVDTPQILKLLEEHGARASFFAVGRLLLTKPDLVYDIIEGGHSIENHTFSHPAATFWCASPRTLEREIALGTHAIRSTAGRSPRFFRSPAGTTNPFLHPVLAHQKLELAGWTASGLDGIRSKPESAARRILNHTRPGSIILLHEGCRDGRDPSWRPMTLRLVLEGLADRNLRCVLPAGAAEA